jgi:hypothetical protein
VPKGEIPDEAYMMQKLIYHLIGIEPMIHLHTTIRELRDLLASKQSTEAIREKANDITIACNTLLKEFAGNKAIESDLEWIRIKAIRMNQAAQGNGGLGSSGPFKYDLAQNDVKSMEGYIGKIGELLSIEFEEIRS